MQHGISIHMNTEEMRE